MYDVHSPRLVAFLREVYQDDRCYHGFALMDTLRRFRRQRGKMEAGVPGGGHALGAGGVTLADTRFLFRLSLWLRPPHVLQFGSRHGLESVAFALPDPAIALTLLEPSGRAAEMARESFERLSIPDQLRTYTVPDLLSLHLPPGPRPSAVLFTPAYSTIEILAAAKHVLAPGQHKLAGDAVVVVTNLDTSRRTLDAWRQLRAMPVFTASVATSRIGILFTDAGMRGPDIDLIGVWAKPWRLGFFS